jgi:hypothetical protein
VDIAAWLRGLGLGEYEAAFRANEIDAAVLPRLTAEDLKDLSGSSRADSAVEPTKSQNITVSCRRSAAAGGGVSGVASVWAPSAAMASSNRRRWPTSVTPRICAR